MSGDIICFYYTRKHTTLSDVEVSDAAKYPIIHMTIPCNRELCGQIVMRLRSQALQHLCFINIDADCRRCYSCLIAEVQKIKEIFQY